MQHTTIYTILSIFFYNTTHTTIHYNAMPYHAIKKLHNTVQNTFYSTRPLYKTTQCNMFCNTHYNTYYNTNTTEHHTTQHNTPQDNTILQYNTNSYCDAYYNACYETRYTASKKYVLQYALRYILQ